ncbi:unnamed protein product [Mesocestoides corti]|uniref:DUF4773 domain-containing protein n=1 Tax=Mesocestoides corti TaxID=53468 RepID=A0A0R3UCG4_MESCO|nr:unnamed protein product [Mesocestoides corti]
MRLIDMRALCLLLLLLQLGSIVPSTIAERNTNWHHTTLPEEITIWIVSVLHESDSAKMGHPADENYGVVVVVDPLTNRVAGFSPFAVALRNFDDLLSPGCVINLKVFENAICVKKHMLNGFSLVFGCARVSKASMEADLFFEHRCLYLKVATAEGLSAEADFVRKNCSPSSPGARLELEATNASSTRDGDCVAMDQTCGGWNHRPCCAGLTCRKLRAANTYGRCSAIGYLPRPTHVETPTTTTTVPIRCDRLST